MRMATSNRGIPFEASRGSGAHAARQPELRRHGEIPRVSTALLAQLNAGRRQRLAEEMRVPAGVTGKTAGERQASARESGFRKPDLRGSEHVFGQQPVIGEPVEARLGAERIEVWYAGRKVEELPRLRGRGKHRVDYRHIIDWLVRKPGAFENYRYREELFPTSRFRMVWDALREVIPQRANKRYLALLEIAAKEGEARVDDALRCLLEQGEIGEGKLSVEAVRKLLSQGKQHAVGNPCRGLGRLVGEL